MGSAAQADASTELRRFAGGFLHASVLPTVLDTITVRREPFVACLPDRRTAPRRAAAHRSEACSPTSPGSCSRDASPSYFDSVLALSTAAGFLPHIQHEVTHWISAVMLVAQGSGVAVVPQAFAGSGIPGVQYLGILENVSESLAHFAWRGTTTIRRSRASSGTCAPGRARGWPEQP